MWRSKQEYKYSLPYEESDLILSFARKIGVSIQVNPAKTPRDHIDVLLRSLYHTSQTETNKNFNKVSETLSLKDLCWLSTNYSDRELGMVALPALRRMGIPLQDFNIAFAFMQGSMRDFDKVPYILKILKEMNSCNPTNELRKAVMVNSKSKLYKDKHGVQAFTADWMKVSTSSEDILPSVFLSGPARAPYQSITMDAPLGLVAKYQDNIIMWSSFMPLRESKEVLVNQLQGANSPKKGSGFFRPVDILNRIDFELTLVETLESFFERWGIGKLVIPEAQYNKWTQKRRDDGSVHLPLPRAKDRYDKTRDEFSKRRRRSD